MQQVNLGSTGTKVSRLCLGTMTYGTSKWRDWVLDERDAIPFYKRALDVGITFFDTADVYSNGESEVVTGRALKQLGVDRENVIVASKRVGNIQIDPSGSWYFLKDVTVSE